MSYVNTTPASFAPLQWNSAFHAGSRGWLQANVPGWGMNPNNAWPKMQAANGLGDGAPAAPAPFTWVGKSPFNHYISQSISPWGRFPGGPAYAAPRPLACPGCIGMPVTPGVGSIVAASRAINAGDLPAAVAALRAPSTEGLGLSCGPCEVTTGDRCLPCPNGSDLPECTGCVDGMSTVKAPWYEHPLMGSIAIGVATAVGTGIVLAYLKRKHVPVG